MVKNEGQIAEVSGRDSTERNLSTGAKKKVRWFLFSTEREALGDFFDRTEEKGVLGPVQRWDDTHTNLLAGTFRDWGNTISEMLDRSASHSLLRWRPDIP